MFGPNRNSKEGTFGSETGAVSTLMVLFSGGNGQWTVGSSLPKATVLHWNNLLHEGSQAHRL